MSDPNNGGDYPGEHAPQPPPTADARADVRPARARPMASQPRPRMVSRPRIRSGTPQPPAYGAAPAYSAAPVYGGVRDAEDEHAGRRIAHLVARRDLHPAVHRLGGRHHHGPHVAQPDQAHRRGRPWPGARRNDRGMGRACPGDHRHDPALITWLRLALPEHRRITARSDRASTAVAAERGVPLNHREELERSHSLRRRCRVHLRTRRARVRRAT